MEFGTKMGLAVRLPDESQEIHYQAQLQRQAKIAAEQKAKMFADDFEYNNAMNGHDNPIVKQYATNKLMEIGNYLRSNPGWETNPYQRAKYKAMTRELKDNPDLNRGMVSDANFNAWQKYQADPKNAEIVNDPEFGRVNTQWENYLKFGNQGGEEAAKKTGKRAFMFIPPEEMQDYTGYLRGIAGDTEFDTYDQKYNGYQIINKQGVSDVARDKAVQLALSGPQAKWIRKDYEKRGGDKALGSIEKFVRSVMDPFYKGDSYETNMMSEWMVNGGSGSEEGQPVDWWQQDTERAFLHARDGYTTPISASRTGAEELLRDKRGYYNLSNGQIYNPKTKNYIPVKSLVTKNASSSDAKMKFVGDPKNPSKGKFMISTNVRMPLDAANEMFDEHIDIADWNPLQGPSVYDKSSKMFSLSKDDDGNSVVEFEVWKPIDNSGTVSAAYNYGNGGSKEKTVSEPGRARVGVDPITKTKWYMDANGNAIRPVE